MKIDKLDFVAVYSIAFVKKHMRNFNVDQCSLLFVLYWFHQIIVIKWWKAKLGWWIHYGNWYHLKHGCADNDEFVNMDIFKDGVYSSFQWGRDCAFRQHYGSKKCIQEVSSLCATSRHGTFFTALFTNMRLYTCSYNLVTLTYRYFFEAQSEDMNGNKCNIVYHLITWVLKTWSTCTYMSKPLPTRSMIQEIS